MVTTLRVPRDKMERFRAIAAEGHRSAAQEMRALIDERIADHETASTADAA